MAAGDTDVSLCNAALALLGAEGLTSLSDGSAQANICATLYPKIKQVTLGMYRWSFTIKKAQLAQDNTTPVSEWTYQYSLPNDILNNVPLAAYTSNTHGNSIFKDWEINMGSDGTAKLMTESQTVYIDYQRVLEENIMPVYFTQLLIYQCAWHLAEPITDQITKTDFWRNIALGAPSENNRGGYFRTAISMDSQGSNQNTIINDYSLTDIR
tara:strand:+ start:90 stop:722 length:633 start_codon:yes stop_codon:yes gene_type:complete